METTINLQEIKQRCEAVTPGPWRSRTFSGRAEIDSPTSEIAVIFLPHEKTMEALRDADFIAASRTDVPAMVAWIEKAELVLTRAVHYCEHWSCKDPDCDCFICDAQRLLSEVTR